MRYTAEDCKLFNYNCNMRSKVNWSVAVMDFKLLTNNNQGNQTKFIQSKCINDFKCQERVKWRTQKNMWPKMGLL